MPKEWKFDVDGFRHNRDGETGDLFHHPEKGWAVIIMPYLEGRTLGSAMPVNLPDGYVIVKKTAAPKEN